MKHMDQLSPPRACMASSPVSLLTVIAALALAVMSCALPGQNVAWAAGPSDKPSVLVIDAGLGDYELASLHWLGEEVIVAGDDSGRMLVTSDHPAWWNAAASSGSSSSAAGQQTGDAGEAPATFLLGSSSGIGSADIAWALDKIREYGAQPRTFVVATGARGLSLRAYAEDLGDVKQSSRADLVGLGFFGTPQNGYSAMEKYPEQQLWGYLALSAGLPLGDLSPQSDFIKRLNGGSFPRMTKTISVAGEAGDLGFGMTDGAGVSTDFELGDTVSDQVEASRVTATISSKVNLTSLWEPFTSSINYAGRSVDANLTDRLSAFSCYETADEVQAVVRDFYRAWFMNGVPVTHNSNVLLLDLSGSMLGSVDASGDKLAAAKEAARQYLQAVQDCSSLPQSAPMDVEVFGFNESITHVASGFDQGSIDAIGNMAARGDTDIGLALDQALSTLRSAPTCASKRILLLSDGEATRGKSDAELLNGAVSEAAASGIVVDTIGFGDVGESDAGFLQQVADATGGTYYQANDTYTLKVNFLKSYYSSLGLNLVDEEVNGGGPAQQTLGATDAQTSALQVGVVGNAAAPNVKLLCNGTPVDGNLCTIKRDNGLTTVQCVNPPIGEYTLELTDNVGAAHVFAVKQLGITHPVVVSGQQADYSMFLLIGAGVLMLAAIVVVIIRTSRKSKASGGAGGYSASNSTRSR